MHGNSVMYIPEVEHVLMVAVIIPARHVGVRGGIAAQGLERLGRTPKSPQPHTSCGLVEPRPYLH
jgi:hypothetical protein